MVKKSEILQIVPRLPGENDGVGDYARTLAQKLSELGQVETLFATADSALAQKNFAHVILHYVNYGYQKRGVPFALLSILREIRARCRGRFLTIFHELYASGPPWKSAFWLCPFQRRIAKSIAQISNAAIVSSETMLQELRQLTPEISASVHPVFSNFGEPTLSPNQLVNRSPHRWAICGGTALLARSLRSFRTMLNRIPKNFSPRDLFVLGGKPSDEIRALIVDLPNIDVDYRPQIAAADASEILASSSFAWLDYLHRADVSTDIILKSSVFAALCAHGVIPVFPHCGTAISIAGDRLPGPFFVDPNTSNLSTANDIQKLPAQFYNWYHRHAAAEHVVREVAMTLGLEQSKSTF
ncbi:MAG: hypothetical protein ACREIW_07265 [Chthoniobacterales bacterium]